MGSNLISPKVALALIGIVLLATLPSCTTPVGEVQMPKASLTPSPTSIERVAPTETPAMMASTATPQATVALRLEAGEGAFAIPLHLQHKTQDQLVLMFELEKAIGGRLYWWPAGAPIEEAKFLPFSDETTRQVLTIDGLEAGERYQVAVALEERDGWDKPPTFLGQVWGPIEVRTLPPSSETLTVGVLGDSGFGEELTRQLAASLAGYDPDLVIHSGDLVYLSYQESDPLAAYQRKWYSTLESLLKTTAIYPVLGNHEYDADILQDGTPYYFEAFPMLQSLDGGWDSGSGELRREWYAIALGDLQVLFLNSQQLFGGSARQAQDNWLAARLADQRFETTVAVFHVPPFTSGRHRFDGAAVVSSWVSAFEAANVVLVISGHDHNFERLERNGITYVVSAGGSSVLYPLGERLRESQLFAAVSHFVILGISSDQIDLTAYDTEGEILDTALIILKDQ